MTCFYCGNNSDLTTGLAHICPEALVKNAHTLPLGAICDSCNNYFGANLDSALLEHPVIALCVQTLGLPGKRGKPRSELGNISRDHAKRTITFPVETPEFSHHPDGSRIATIRPLAHPKFESTRFSRALHYVALNAAAAFLGLDRVLEPDFDPVRRYVRFPKKGEAWPFASYSADLEPIRKLVEVDGVETEDAAISHLKIFSLDFYVDLLNSGLLEQWVKQHVPDAYFGLPEKVTPTPSNTKFRVVIDLDS
jgi:hypothetical protein